jgi:tetratricopeptide (TPR) repeat protein
MNTDPEINQWREKTNRLISVFTDHIRNGNLDHIEIAEFVREAAGAVLKRERLQTHYLQSEFKGEFETLYQYIQLSMNYEGALAMIPIQAALMASGELSPEELIEYMHESILLKKGLVETKTSREPHGSEDEVADTFNALLDKVEEAADRDDYISALLFLDEAFELAEENPLLTYDRLNMINNRAFYNCQIGKYEEGLRDCAKASEEDPDYGVIYHTKAEILFEMKKYGEALEAINDAIRKEDSPDKHSFKDQILNKLKR